VLIAMPGAGAAALEAALEPSRAAGLVGRVVPRPELQIRGGAPAEAASEPAALLGRRSAALGDAPPRAQISGRAVLVTGAAGSIGSELCRQLVRCRPARLIAFDQSESGLFELGEELGAAVTPVVGDVRDRGAVESALAEHRPEIVFHAAALKHVPLLEAHPFEALATNALGSARVAEACHRHRVACFVLVSTDKAVAPVSVMGASKQLAERLCLALAGPARIVAVRFGNVLDSRGSVVPVFRRQIRSGGPLRITHPEMQRYLMTIPEAAQLLLYATHAGATRDVLVLDMGEPVRILDLAHRLIALAGLEPERDVPIAFTGLRPGEKLREELIAAGERRSPAGHPLVWRVEGERWTAARARQAIARIEQLVAERDEGALTRFWKEVLPDFWLARQGAGRELPYGEVAHCDPRGYAGRDPVETGEEPGVPGMAPNDEAFGPEQRGREAELERSRPGVESLPAGREQRV
jgi:FlaA1/EpsC-like NDP-sugar epimerase